MVDYTAQYIARQLELLKHANKYGFASYNTKQEPCPACKSTGLCHCSWHQINSARAEGGE